MKNSAELQPQPPSIWNNLFKFIAVLFILFLVLSAFAPAPGGDCIARIKVKGEIVYDAPESLFGDNSANTPENIGGLLKEADADGNVRAIMIEVNSPGGSAVASKEMYDEIRDVKKPTLSYMTEVAASGGYYICAATDYIVAHPNTVTGSIGARTTVLNYEGLFEKLGLREDWIKSGDLKDIGAGYRNMTRKEKELLQEDINEKMLLFKQDVEAGRKGKLNFALFNEAMDARILSASKARQIGLIDEIGGLKAAIASANKMAGNNETAEEGMLPLCDFGNTKGFSLFSDFSAQIGKSLARGFVQGVREESAAAQYK
ncbi:MAG: signal peptide peptidase SppA [Candidatus Micrarchaeota archaeon]